MKRPTELPDETAQKGITYLHNGTPAWQPPDAVDGPDERLRGILVEAGVTPSALDEVVEQIDGVAHSLAITYAATRMLDVMQWLDGSHAGVALKRVLIGDGGKSLRQAAKDVGISAPGLLKLERKIKARIAKGG
jgi:hypothetical protein